MRGLKCCCHQCSPCNFAKWAHQRLEQHSRVCVCLLFVPYLHIPPCMLNLLKFSIASESNCRIVPATLWAFVFSFAGWRLNGSDALPNGLLPMGQENQLFLMPLKNAQLLQWRLLTRPPFKALSRIPLSHQHLCLDEKSLFRTTTRGGNWAQQHRKNHVAPSRCYWNNQWPP